MNGDLCLIGLRHFGRKFLAPLDLTYRFLTLDLNASLARAQTLQLEIDSIECACHASNKKQENTKNSNNRNSNETS